MKLWTNGLFYTMENEGATVESVLANETEIIATGSADQLKTQYGDLIKEEIDLKGATVLPGLVDSHLHLLWYGQSLARLNLNQQNSRTAALKMIADKVATLKPDEWLFVEGYNENMWEDDGRGLTYQDLDQISTRHPILVRRIDYHNVVINSPFIKKIQLKNHQVFEGGGEIDLTPDGKLTGILKDEATNLAIDAFPLATPAEMENYLKIAIEDLWSKGITGGHSEDLHYFNGFTGTFKTFTDVVGNQENQLPFRAHLLIHNAELANFNQSNETFLSNHPWVELGAMKIFYDGTVGSKTALMSHSYPNEPTQFGLQVQTDEVFETMVKDARKAELPVAIHILGDQAFENVITTLKKYPPKVGQLDRMIHTPWLRPDLLKKASGMPLLFDLQPQFMSSDLPWALEVLGETHPPLAFAWKSIQKAGFATAGGSDAPVEIPNPFYGIHAAVTRTVSSDLDGKHYFPEEALSRFEAIRLYTVGSAKACYHETTRGMIKPGFVSDFTILKDNPFTVSTKELRTIKVLKTVIANQIVFSIK